MTPDDPGRISGGFRRTFGLFGICIINSLSLSITDSLHTAGMDVRSGCVFIMRLAIPTGLHLLRLSMPKNGRAYPDA